MNVVLVRHGRPDESDESRPHDPPLSAEGKAQADWVASRLADEGVARIVTSPLLRARQTASPLASRLGLAVAVVEGWAEADRHLPRYRSGETLKGLGDVQWQRFLDDPLGFLGRDAGEFRANVLGAVDEVLATRGGPVAVFTHGLVINQVLSHILGLPKIVHFHPGYGSFTRLRVRSSGALAIISINETGHHALAAPNRALS